MSRLLVVDDEREYVTPYIEKLGARYAVDYCQSAEESVRMITGTDHYDALVLDNQMPPPEGVPASRTNFGQDTGLWILKEVEASIRVHSTSVVILTNRDLRNVRSSVEKLGFAEGAIEVLSKKTTPYEQLPDIVETLLPRVIRTNATVLRRWDDDSVALAVRDPRVGWFEFDIPASAVDRRRQVGDQLPVAIKVDRNGDVMSYHIRPDAIIASPETQRFGDQLTANIPKPPADLRDSAAVQTGAV